MREKEVIELNRKQFMIVSTLNIENIKYAYIINTDCFNETFFVKTNEKKKEIEIIEDKDKLKELINMFHLHINQQKLSENG